MRAHRIFGVLAVGMCVAAMVGLVSAQEPSVGNREDGKRLFERETFGGNGRTCVTCHSAESGTVSPADAQRRLQADPSDPLFVHDGSDDGLGHGVARMLTDATVLINIPMAANVSLAGTSARTVTLRRGIPTTLNTPALDRVLMLDGRQPTLEAQALGALHDHAQNTQTPTAKDLERIKDYQLTDAFFSSPALRNFARGGAAPTLPQGTTASERRGRRFFEDVPPDPTDGFRPGLCAHCHSGPLMNQTNRFAPDFIGLPIPTGTRFQNILVSFFNQANNPVNEFVFDKGTAAEVHVLSTDAGRALVTGVVDDGTNSSMEAFKISALRGVRRTAPYFHDNSAKTLEDVAKHYTRFFNFVTGGLIQLTPQDEADLVAFMKLLD
jgi:cytochrome c peroxidase